MKQETKKYTLLNYIEYIRDNPEGYWFKRRLYGWGWVPATWQGWLITLAFIVILISYGFYFASMGNPTERDLAIFFVTIAISIIVLILVCYKTGEKPQWTWGRIVKINPQSRTKH